MIEIKLIENKEKGTFRVTWNGKDCYTDFTNEVEAKAAAFNEILKAQAQSEVCISYHSF